MASEIFVEESYQKGKKLESKKERKEKLKRTNYQLGD
jgi:hypothetical protein